MIAVGAERPCRRRARRSTPRALHVLPGAIDVHVHFRDPGYPHKEDFASGTAAAAFGGVTTVFDMPNTIPPTGTPEILAAKHKMAAEKAHVDFGLYGLLGEDTIEHAPELAQDRHRLQALHGQHLRRDSRRPLPARCWRRSRWSRRPASACRCTPKTNSIMVRRETADARGRANRSAGAYRVAAGGGRDRGGEPRGDPRGMDRRRIHILHISSAEELRPLREAKARGVDITGETCPQYLFLSTDDYARFGGVIRVNPPVREKRNQEPLLAALADGTVDVIATDHAPHSVEEKTRNDIWTVDCGFPGVETQMPMMLTEVAAGRYSVSRLRALERSQSGQDLGTLSAQGRHPARRRRRHRDRRSRPRMDDRRRQAAIAVPDHAVPRPRA